MKIKTFETFEDAMAFAKTWDRDVCLFKAKDGQDWERWTNMDAPIDLVNVYQEAGSIAWDNFEDFLDCELTSAKEVFKNGDYTKEELEKRIKYLEDIVNEAKDEGYELIVQDINGDIWLEKNRYTMDWYDESNGISYKIGVEE